MSTVNKEIPIAKNALSESMSSVHSTLKTMRQRLDRLENEKNEPLAIVGMNCRFPGGANTPEQFWDMLLKGSDAISEVPASHWSIDEFYDPVPMTPGKTYCRYGGFIDNVDKFDASFFGLSTKEAESMDPQQRILLETCWEALEGTAAGKEQSNKCKTGVFIGATTVDYALLMIPQMDPQFIGPYFGTGNTINCLAGRIAFCFGFEGPCMTIDTACSSSLVSLYNACASLRMRECDRALVGGVNLILSPMGTIASSQAQMLAVDGRCKTFDQAANGYVRSEGCGVVVVKRLADALNEGDNILAIVRGIAVNHGGRSGGFTVPSARAQRQLIELALDNAKVDPFTVDYVEAHGTGTPLGDPIEIKGLSPYYTGRAIDSPLIVGSVKTNMGHLEAASGMCGLIKIVLMLKNGMVPPHLHYKTPNPHIPWESTSIAIPTKPTAWSPEGVPRRAGISSFGVSGINAHAILEQALPNASHTTNLQLPYNLLVLSAKSKSSLKQSAQRYVSTLTLLGAEGYNDACHTTRIGRRHFNERIAIVAKNAADTVCKLDGFMQGQDVWGLVKGSCPAGSVEPQISFLFTGQGCQYAGMGSELYKTAPVFRELIDQCSDFLKEELQTPLSRFFTSSPEESEMLLADPVYSHVALTALQYATAGLWRSWGIVPEAVLGHSMGMYAAACIASVITLEELLRIVITRARLAATMPPGAMLVVMASDEIVTKELHALKRSNEIAVAAINGPECTLLSGTPQAVWALKQRFDAQSIQNEQLSVKHAFHTPLVEPILPLFRETLSKVNFKEPRIRIFCGVESSNSQLFVTDPEFWVEHLRTSVNFKNDMVSLYQAGYKTMIEIGSKPNLLSMASQCIDSFTGALLPSMQQGISEWAQMLQSLGSLYCAGVEVDWAEFTKPLGGRLMSLPTYSFDRKRYWPDEAIRMGHVDRERAGGDLENIQTIEMLSNGEISDKLTPEEQKCLPHIIELLKGAQSRASLVREVKDMTYEVVWRKRNLDRNGPKRTSIRRWVIFCHSDEWEQALVTQLRKRGAESCLTIAIGENREFSNGKHYVLNPFDDEGIREALQQVVHQNDQVGVVYMWSCQHAQFPPKETKEVIEYLRMNWVALQSIVKSLESLDESGKSAQLWLLTQQAMPADSHTSIAYHQSPFWGIGRTLALEYPSIWAGNIDIWEASEFNIAASRLVDELESSGDEDGVALRQNSRYIVRLIRSEGKRNGDMVFDPQGTYLLTGGTGGLGIRLAQWMTERGARNLVLASRSGKVGADGISAIDKIRSNGANIIIEKVDVSERDACENMVKKLEITQAPLLGIMHLAGVIDDGLFVDLDWHRTEQVLAPKVLGALNLHDATRATPLQFFLCFSSVAASLGSAGQANYAAANLFMDALMEHRRREGVCGQSVNWGPWDEYGMAARMDKSETQRIGGKGIRGIPIEAGLLILGDLLALNTGQRTIVRIDWERFLQNSANGNSLPPVFEELGLETLHSQISSHSSLVTDLRSELSTLNPALRCDHMTEYLLKTLARTLGIEQPSSIAADRGFAEMGMNSLMTIELRNRIQKDFGLRFSPSVIFNHPTILTLGEYILDQLNLSMKNSASTSVVVTQSSACASEPIAIVGIGCRYPGGITDPDSFWKILENELDVISEVPADRWPIDDYFDPNRNAPGKVYTKFGGFVDNIGDFDPLFFGISPREAESMDPQHRLLLEVCWEAIEHAGLNQRELVGSNTGVYVGVAPTEYVKKLIDAKNRDFGVYDGTGNGLCFSTGRVSYVLGLQGPCTPVDTACSSSLVAVHLACQSLRSGECNMALAGGAQLNIAPETNVFLCRSQALSPDGRCNTFGADANGYVRGEGCGIVVLKRLSDALANNDTVLAVIAGSAVNHDGPSSGLTVPNGLAQRSVIRQALINARIDAAQVNYVEAHGTGTIMGDPIEVETIGEVFGVGRENLAPLKIGSVKTNIGHCEVAAGVAGLIKVVLSLNHNRIPAHLNFTIPNPHIPWANYAIEVAHKSSEWKRTDFPRIAGVSSFGLSGTNAHIVITEPPQDSSRPIDEFDGGVLTISAKSRPALIRACARYLSHLSENPTINIGDLCYTANIGRCHFEHRIAVVSYRKKELTESLSGILVKEIPAEGVYASSKEVVTKPKVAFLFTGQGSQYLGMAKRLYERNSEFHSLLSDMDNRVTKLWNGRSLLSVLFGDGTGQFLLDDTTYTQPALFCVEYALAKLLIGWGIHPTGLLGHSIGEFVAWCIGGTMSVEEALEAVVERARLMGALPQKGKMMAIAAELGVIKEMISHFDGRIVIAAINSPIDIVVSGESASIDQLGAKLQLTSVKHKELKVSHAFHSHMMEPMLPQLADSFGKLKLSKSTCSVVSNLTGKILPMPESVKYWCDHVRESVRFSDGIDTLQKAGCTVFVEIGPAPVLRIPGEKCVAADSNVQWIGTLDPKIDDCRSLNMTLAKLYTCGVDINWKSTHDTVARKKIAIPSYPFERQRFWVEENQNQVQLESRVASDKSILLQELQEGRWERLAQRIKSKNILTEEQKIHVNALAKGFSDCIREDSPSMKENLLYTMSWRCRPLVPSLIQRDLKGISHWLIFGDYRKTGDRLCAFLESQGFTCSIVNHGDWAILGENRYRIDHSNKSHYGALFTELKSRNSLPLAGVINLWSLDASDERNISCDCIDKDIELSCRSSLYIVQQLLENRNLGFVRCWFITERAVKVSSADTSIAPAQSPLWGMVRTLSQETPQYIGGIIDIDIAESINAASIGREIMVETNEQYVAIHKSRRFVARLTHAGSRQTTTPMSTLAGDAQYLVTGAFGGIGLRIAQWLFDRGARRLILISRNGASTLEAQETVKRLRDAGCVIREECLDVADQAQTARLFEELRGQPEQLRGIIHAAGSIDDGLITDLNWNRFTNVFSSKIAALWNIHCQSQSLELDFFLIFSSSASLLGSLGQANYAAANAFCDAVGHLRQISGQPSLVVNWGPWDEVGMASKLDAASRARMEGEGISFLSPDRALKALETLLVSPPSVATGVFDLSWERFSAALQGRKIPGILQEVIQVVSTNESSLKIGEGRNIAAEVNACHTYEGRVKLLTECLRNEVMRILRIADEDAFDDRRGFWEMGMDSLTATELRNTLQVMLDKPVSATAVFNNPSVEMLVGYILYDLLGFAQPQVLAEETTSLLRLEEHAKEVDDLSEAQLEELLLKELQSNRSTE